jgi:hypothetical protein
MKVAIEYYSISNYSYTVNSINKHMNRKVCWEMERGENTSVKVIINHVLKSYHIISKLIIYTL